VASDQFLLVSQFAAAAALFTLAGALLWLKFSNPVNRSFALFLFFRGMIIVANQMKLLASGATSKGLWNSAADYYLIGAVPALLYFLLCYGFPLGGKGIRAAKAFTVIAGLLLGALYAFDHCLGECGPNLGSLKLGPLAFFYYGIHPALAGAALFLAWRAQKERVGAKRQALRLLSLAFILNALLDATIVAWFDASSHLGATAYAPSPWLAPVLLTPLAVFPLALPTLVLLGRIPNVRGKPSGLSTGVLAVLAVVSGALVNAASQADLSLYPGLFLIGVWRIVLPAMAAYAIVRHRLFDLDLKIRWTLRRGTIVGVFLAVFFVTNQVAQNFLSAKYGVVAGGVSAGLLLFALSPLERLGHRVADAVGPRPPPATGLDRRARLQLYQEQATLVWSDGTMGRKEAHLLDKLRSSLGLTYEEVGKINQAASNL
jgi:hypothetical protein